MSYRFGLTRRARRRLASCLELWLPALNVQYWDVRYVLPFLTRFGLFATLIAYPSSFCSPNPAADCTA